MSSIINATTTAGVSVQGDNSGSLQLATNNGTTAVTIDTSQNVGIGTATITSDTGWIPKLVLSATTPALVVKGSSGQECNFGISNSLYIDSLGHSTGTNNNIIFRNTATNSSYSATERMRITSGGQLLVGTTTGTTLSSVAWRTTLSGAGNNLAVLNTDTGGATTIGFQAANYTGGGSTIVLFYNGSGGSAGSITLQSNASTGTTVAYNTSSDYRMKENIAPMSGALNKVLQLKPVTYTWKSNGYTGQGFIAHELAEICPDAVSGEKDAVDAEGNPVYQGVDTSFLVATLTSAIQELKAELDATKAEVQALKGVA
jgi:hypothetical protein